MPAGTLRISSDVILRSLTVLQDNVLVSRSPTYTFSSTIGYEYAVLDCFQITLMYYRIKKYFGKVQLRLPSTQSSTGWFSKSIQKCKSTDHRSQSTEAKDPKQTPSLTCTPITSKSHILGPVQHPFSFDRSGNRTGFSCNTKDNVCSAESSTTQISSETFQLYARS